MKPGILDRADFRLIGKTDERFIEVKRRVFANLEELCKITGKNIGLSQMKENLHLTVKSGRGQSYVSERSITIFLDSLGDLPNTITAEESAHYFDNQQYPGIDPGNLLVSNGLELVGRLYSSIQANRYGEEWDFYHCQEDIFQKRVNFIYKHFKDEFLPVFIPYLEDACRVLSGDLTPEGFNNLRKAVEEEHPLIDILNTKLGQAVEWYNEKGIPDNSSESENIIFYFTEDKIPLLFKDNIRILFDQERMTEADKIRSEYKKALKNRRDAERHRSYELADKLHLRYWGREKEELRTLAKLLQISPHERVRRAEEILETLKIS